MRISLQVSRAGSLNQAGWIGASMGVTRLAEPGSCWREGDSPALPPCCPGLLPPQQDGVWKTVVPPDVPLNLTLVRLLQIPSSAEALFQASRCWDMSFTCELPSPGNEVWTPTGRRMLFIFLSPLQPVLFWVSLSCFDSPRLQAKAAAGANQHSFSDIDGVTLHQQMNGPLVLGQQHDCSACGFHLPCQTCSISRPCSSPFKETICVTRLCHNHYMNLLLTEFSEPRGAVQCHFPSLCKALPHHNAIW